MKFLGNSYKSKEALSWGSWCTVSWPSYRLLARSMAEIKQGGCALGKARCSSCEHTILGPCFTACETILTKLVTIHQPKTDQRAKRRHETWNPPTNKTRAGRTQALRNAGKAYTPTSSMLVLGDRQYVVLNLTKAPTAPWKLNPVSQAKCS
jgi:hypothetical protein